MLSTLDIYERWTTEENTFDGAHFRVHWPVPTPPGQGEMGRGEKHILRRKMAKY